MKKEDITYEIIEHLAILSETKSGWRLEANMVSWNGKEPVLDIRNWNSDKTKIGKGITLNEEERSKLKSLL